MGYENAWASGLITSPSTPGTSNLYVRAVDPTHLGTSAPVERSRRWHHYDKVKQVLEHESWGWDE